jgi:hypothetical protein
METRLKKYLALIKHYLALIKDYEKKEKMALIKDYEKKEKNHKIVVEQQCSILEHDKAVSKLVTFENRDLKKELEAERNKVNSEIDLMAQLEKAKTDLALALKDSKAKEAEIVKFKAGLKKELASVNDQTTRFKVNVVLFQKKSKFFEIIIFQIFLKNYL